MVFFTLIFSALCDFFELFLDCTKGSPLHLFRYFATMNVKKSQRVPSFTFFGTVTLFKDLILNFFRKFSKISQGSVLLSICFIFCNQLEFHKAQKVPSFTILSLRYSADFGRSRLVFSQFHLP